MATKNTTPASPENVTSVESTTATNPTGPLPAADITMKPSKSVGWWVTAVAIVVIIAAAAYATLINPLSNTAPLLNQPVDSTSTSDPVVEELQAVSGENDASVIQSELEATNLDDVATEFDDISAETKGL